MWSYKKRSGICVSKFLNRSLNAPNLTQINNIGWLSSNKQENILFFAEVKENIK